MPKSKSELVSDLDKLVQSQDMINLLGDQKNTSAKDNLKKAVDSLLSEVNQYPTSPIDTDLKDLKDNLLTPLQNELTKSPPEQTTLEKSKKEMETLLNKMKTTLSSAPVPAPAQPLSQQQVKPSKEHDLKDIITEIGESLVNAAELGSAADKLGQMNKVLKKHEEMITAYDEMIKAAEKADESVDKRAEIAEIKDKKIQAEINKQSYEMEMDAVKTSMAVSSVKVLGSVSKVVLAIIGKPEEKTQEHIAKSLSRIADILEKKK